MLLFISISSAGALLTNGDFEEPLHIGWSLHIDDPMAGYDTLDRDTSFHPDPDYEVKVKKFNLFYARLYQTVEIPATDLAFSVYAKLYAYEHSPSQSYWAAASIVLSYLNSNDNLLGQTRICYKTPHCPWNNSDTVHLIVANDTLNWYTYSFNINDELTNLPGINPLEIAKINITMLDTTNGC